MKSTLLQDGILQRPGIDPSPAANGFAPAEPAPISGWTSTLSTTIPVSSQLFAPSSDWWFQSSPPPDAALLNIGDNSASFDLLSSLSAPPNLLLAQGSPTPGLALSDTTPFSTGFANGPAWIPLRDATQAASATSDPTQLIRHASDGQATVSSQPTQLTPVENASNSASKPTVTTHQGGAGFTIIPQYDASVTDLSNPANPNYNLTLYDDYTGAVKAAINYYESIITNPVTITIDFGYGEVGDNQGNSGMTMPSFGGESTFSIYGYNYGSVYNAVVANADNTQSQVQLTAAANLPATDPDTLQDDSGGDLWMSPANGLALGLGGSPPGTDGSIGNIGIGSVATSGPELGDSWAWSPSQTTGTTFDAVATLEHEISEVMGREDFVGTNDASYSLLDMYRYSAPVTTMVNGMPVTTPGQLEQPFESYYDSTVQTYFSFDGGNEITLPYDKLGSGDAGDWVYADNNGTFDAYDGTAVNGLVGQISTTDLQELQAIGWNIPSAACFRSGTRIKTDHGERAIETLRIGDRVATMSGGTRPIRWIGRRSYRRSEVSGNGSLLPIRFRTGALGEGAPQRDLWVSPDHAMWIDGMLIPAHSLVNGLSIVQDESVDAVDYIHLEFDTHDVIFADGAPSESFVDDDSRERFDNAAEFRRLYPDARREPARFCAPRVEEGETLEAVRQRLRARAGAQVAAHGASTWRGNLDRVERGRIEGWARDESEPGRPLTLRILDNGVTIGQARADRYREDLQTAGIGDGRHAFVVTVPGGLRPDIDHVIEVRRGDDGRPLYGSPFVVRSAQLTQAAR